MPNYLVELFLPRVRAVEAPDLARQVQDAATPEGTVRFVRAVSAPTQELCLCLYSAPSAAAVAAAVRAAGLSTMTAPEEVELFEALEQIDVRVTRPVPTTEIPERTS